ncbi:MAG TPA: NADH-quinone oxidoreductase subunit NuoG [Solirubrobacteraceae bacterium]|nr:NADH-quinone oxidoreductase subunit NuoG [Solirubrobacteraceae bacterium]
MPRPEQHMVTLTIDGREVSAPEGTMLVDGAKRGDVEIPVFCYEPKLGQPVGACRMCLVEVEGIPKLQTGCSTPIKDGMVVHTQTQRVREAQQSVVEFLLINHPLDCPVCDKGGECPLQDITFGWGAGRSRFIEPKRHFRKPLELSPTIAIDRERCILCYRCVRFSQEISEDYQLVLHERADHSYVGTFDGHPYVAPFSGNIIELCPVGALTSSTYRFRARPWDIEQAGSVCLLCPAQCNVSFTVRDELVQRVLARDNEEVDDGWLCDKGRFAYQAIHVDERITEPLVRDGDALRPASWERALELATDALNKARGGKAAALAGGQTTNEEAFALQRLMREGLACPDIDSRAGGRLELELERALAAPSLQTTVADLEFAHAVLVLDCEPVDDAPIIDLRIRKGVRRHGTKLAIASSRPSALDAGAHAVLRFAPGAAEAAVRAITAALSGEGDLNGLAAAAGADPESVRATAKLLTDAGSELAIVWGERLASGARAGQAGRALLNLAARLGLSDVEHAGLLELPASSNGRGLREAGFLPTAGPGYSEPGASGRDAPAIAAALADGELSTLYLLHCDPLRTHPDRGLWERALAKAGAVIAHESSLSATVAEHATVVFPAESYAEKEGTVVHPDGRLQRLRSAIARPGEVSSELQVLAELASRLGDIELPTGAPATAELVGAVPFYAGITLEEIGGRGVRWWQRDAAAADALAEAPLGPFELDNPPAAAQLADGELRLGTYRSLWASSEVELSPALAFLGAKQHVELNPDDADRLGLVDGEAVRAVVNGSSVAARVALRAAVPAGTAFLAEGTAADSANALLNGAPRSVRLERAPR